MKTIGVSDARSRFAGLGEDVARGAAGYVVTRRGRPRAVLMSSEEHEALLETLDVLSRTGAVERVRRGLAELARGETVTFEEAFGEPA